MSAIENWLSATAKTAVVTAPRALPADWRPKARNWRERQGWYTPQGFRVHVAGSIGDRSAYLAWLQKSRGIDEAAALDILRAQEPCRMVSATHNGPALVEVEVPVVKPARVRSAAKAMSAPRVSERLPESVDEVQVAEPVVVVEATVVVSQVSAAVAVSDYEIAVRVLRELAAGYGPRRAHKLEAMAAFVEAAAVPSKAPERPQKVA